MRAKLSGIVAVSVALFLSVAGVGSASAHKFLASKAPGTLHASGGLQTFVVKAKKEGLRTECKKVTGTGTIEKTESEKQIATLTYEECKFAAGNTKINNIEAEYEFFASGEVKILKTITITSSEAGICTVTVPAGQMFTGITYTNEPANDITVSANVSGIKSSGTGSLEGCKYTEAEDETGTYKGSAVTEEVGGTLKWE